MRVVRAIAAFLLVLFSLPVVSLGGSDVWKWVRVQWGDIFYVDFNYLAQGLPILIPGLIALGVAGYVPLRRKASGLLLLIPLLLLFLLAIAIPSFLRSAGAGAISNVRGRVRTVSTALEAWSAEKERFPANEAEFHAAREIPQGEEGNRSPYARGGQRLSYRVVYVGGAAGPYLPSPPAEQPAVIYCATSQDLKRLWLTATVLEDDVGGAVVWLQREPGQPWVEEVSLPATSAVKK